MAEPKTSLAIAAQKALDDLNGRSIYSVRSTLVPMNTPVTSDSLNALATEVRLRLGENLDSLDLNKLSLTPKQLAISYHGSIGMNELFKKIVPEVLGNEVVENVSLQTWIHRIFGNAAGQGMDLQTATDKICSNAKGWSDSKKAFVCHVLQAVAFYRECVYWTDRSAFHENLLLVMINTQLNHVWLDDPSNDGLVYFNDMSLAQWYFVVDGIVNKKPENDLSRVSRDSLAVADLAELPYGLFKPPRGLSIVPFRKPIPATVGRISEPATRKDHMTKVPEPNLNDDAAIALYRARHFLQICIYNLPELELECDYLPPPSKDRDAHSRLETEIKEYETQVVEHLTLCEDALQKTSAKFEQKEARLFKKAAKVERDMEYLNDQTIKLFQRVEELLQGWEDLDEDSAEFQVRAMIYAQIQEPIEELRANFNPDTGDVRLRDRDNTVKDLTHLIESQKDFRAETTAFRTFSSAIRTHLPVFKEWYKLDTSLFFETESEDKHDN